MAFAKRLRDQEITISCDFCFRDITKQTYFRCEDCRFDSCALCTYEGMETEIHNKSHRYRIVSNLYRVIEGLESRPGAIPENSSSLPGLDFTLETKQNTLTSLNFPQKSETDFQANHRSKSETDFQASHRSKSETDFQASQRSKSETDFQASHRWRLIDELLLLDGLISFGFDNFEDISKVLRPKTEASIKRHLYRMIGIYENNKISADSMEASNTQVKKSNPNDSCVASFMSKRQEFDSEILNEYETLIDDLVFEEDDSELETEFKRFLLENYRNVLRRRKVWREFLLQRNIPEMNKLKEKENTELCDALAKKKWIAQYLSKEDFNIFVAGIAMEGRLKAQLLRDPMMVDICEEKLTNNLNLLSKRENELCNSLNVPISIYLKLKRMALEMYRMKLPLKGPFFELFAPEDEIRAAIIFRWFVDQKIVVEE